MSEAIKPWKRARTKQLADCRIFSLYEADSESPETGDEHSFFYIETADWVNVIPVTPANELVCIRQFRHGSEEVTLEIPGGMIDRGEKPEEAAARECLEESGYKAGELIPLGSVAPNPALFGNRLYTFVAPNVERVAEVSNTEREITEVQLIPMQQLPDFLVSGEIDHALVAAALWRMLYYLKQD